MSYTGSQPPVFVVQVHMSKGNSPPGVLLGAEVCCQCLNSFPSQPRKNVSCTVHAAIQHDKMNAGNITELRSVRLLVSKEELH